MREPSLAGAKAKFDWSHKHFKCLDSKIKRWIETNPHATTTELYPEAGIVALRSNAPEPPLEFGVMAGNIIHCLRSMLDYLVWELVLLNRREPQRGPGGAPSAIYTEPPKKGFERATASDLAGVHPDHQAMIKWSQPYDRTDQIEVARNPLTGLVELSNTDKHQFLHTPAVAITSLVDFEFGIRAIRDIASFGDNELLGSGHMKRGAIFGWAEVTLSGLDPEVEMKGEPPLEVRFEDGPEVVSSLRNIANSVSTVFGWFSPLFVTGKPGPQPQFRDP